MPTVVHVTHEAVHQFGGIGAVLQGILTTSSWWAETQRNILVGPYWPGQDDGPEHRLGPHGEILYSGIDGIRRTPLADALHEVERRFDVRIIYGRRRFSDFQGRAVAAPEVLLIDLGRVRRSAVDEFKFKLWERYGIDSARYEQDHDYEQWVSLGPPAVACLHAVSATSGAAPCVILSHEYMGIPTALAAQLDGGPFRTILHAHECATARRIVEKHPGHDTLFYSVMPVAIAEGIFLEDVFGDQSDFYKHALIKAAARMDAVFAVGDQTLQEFRFLTPEFGRVPMHLAYNGVPCWPIDAAEKDASRELLRQYCDTLLQFRPDWILTHVTRLVPSKGLWRDFRVLRHLEAAFARTNETAVFFALTTETAARRPADILEMEAKYDWPVVHREGHPDLTPGEADYYQLIQAFNARSRNVKVLLINQFGFDAARCGRRVPEAMSFMDIRKGSDVEFGQSIYEPFGIAQIEPISFGGICVFTNVCGCAGFVRQAGGGDVPNVVVADYTGGRRPGTSLDEMMKLGRSDREKIEEAEAARVADELLRRLPRSASDIRSAIERGYNLAKQMSWDEVCKSYLLPGIRQVIAAGR